MITSYRGGFGCFTARAVVSAKIPVTADQRRGV
jgi:hypothetical protein